MTGLVFFFIACISFGSATVLTDIEAVSLEALPGFEAILQVERDQPVQIKVALKIRNNGNANIPPPIKPLENNFAFRLDVVSKNEGSSVQSWQVSSSDDTVTSLNINQVKTVTLGCTINISSAQCSKQLEICGCIKSERINVPLKSGRRMLKSSFTDSNEENDIICMPLSCKSVPGAEGDPHFLVYGSLSKLPLCFDIIGRAGEELILLNDTKAGWSVSAHVLDDRYFHAVSVRSANNVVMITTDKVVNTSLTWGNFGGYVMGNIHLSMGKSKDEKSMMVTTGKSSRTMVVRVNLAKHFDKREHLDIHIEEHDEMDEYIGGILGEAKKNYLGSENSVQFDQPYGAVFIKEKYFPAKLATRGGSRCWLVAPSQALYPFKVRDFIQY
ncbi:DgyrCDS11102 [Dimorphilus gyrociliatus]|uniref:DgyrCDS11102 n=1 Tax=Dimorphilus gyrociliatus TaxID=2664684 RepID=A0A7I8W479_9ANNE|nr:DgyrCDS11102 [Dimorphilus gyrociliatus]